MIIEKIREYMLTCPYLDDHAKINVDYLGTNAVEYSIDSVPSTETIKEYVNGDKIKQYMFVYGSREYYGPDALQNMENNGFYEKVSDWLEEKTRKDDLPDLSEDRQAIKVETLSNGYLFHADEEKARYQMQARLVYYEKNVRRY